MDQEEYDQQIQKGYIQNVPNPLKFNENFQRWLLDDYEEVHNLQLSLRGITYDPNKNEYIYDEKTRLMNDQGARVLTETILIPAIKNSKLTNYQPEEINEQLKEFMERLSDHLFLNADTYKIKEKDYDQIITLIDTIMNAVFRRSLYGAEQERLGDTQKSVYEERGYVGQQPMPQQVNKKGIRDYLPW